MERVLIDELEPARLRHTGIGYGCMVVMRTTLELPDPLFARLKVRAASKRLTLNQLLRSYAEQGLNATPAGSGSKRSAHTLPYLEGPLAIEGEHLSNAALFGLLDA